MTKCEEIREIITKDMSFEIKTMLLQNYTVGVSKGIQILLDREPASVEQIQKMIDRFLHADFGSMYKTGETVPQNWNEPNAFGEYNIDCVDVPIYIHYEAHDAYGIIIYFAFER